MAGGVDAAFRPVTLKSLADLHVGVLPVRGPQVGFVNGVVVGRHPQHRRARVPGQGYRPDLAGSVAGQQVLVWHWLLDSFTAQSGLPGPVATWAMVRLDGAPYPPPSNELSDAALREPAARAAKSGRPSLTRLLSRWWCPNGEVVP